MIIYNVVIVDDHLLIAKAIGAIIDNYAQYKVLYEVANGRELQEKFSDKKNIPDIVLLDISMPIMNGFDTAKWLKENYRDVLVLALSMQDDEESLLRMVRNGAKGYLLKNIHPTELENALHQVVDKGYYYPQWATSIVFQAMGEKKTKGETQIHISDKEKEFIIHSCSELTYKEIADAMHLSPRTIEGYRDSMFEKLGIKSRVGLALYAIKNKWVKV